MSVARKARGAAPRPPARTVDVELGGEFAGWTCTARADFSVALIEQLGNLENLGDVCDVMDRIVLVHNFPNDRDEIAERMRDVVPHDGVLAAAAATFEALRAVPNRNGRP